MIVLGLLMSQPMNGYEIQRSARTTSNLFWAELKYGHIYPALQSLLEEGFIEVHEQSTSEKGKKSTKYKITETGKKYLSTWIDDDDCKDVTKSETLAKLFFSSLDNVRTQIDRINRLYVESEKNLELLTSQQTRLQTVIDEAKNQDPSLIFNSIVLEFGLNYFAGMKNLTQKSLGLLKTLEESAQK